MPQVDAAASDLYRRSPALARDYLTAFSAKQSQRVVARWASLWHQLFVRYLDGNVRDEHGGITHPGYPEAWYRRVLDERPDHFKVQTFPGDEETSH